MTSATTQSTAMTGLERLVAMQQGELEPPPAVALVGLSLDEAEEGRVVFSMIAGREHENPMGTMHGGMLATLVDTAMGCAVSSTLGSDEAFTTLELHMNFVRAVTKDTGRITAVGNLVHRGGRVATVEARVHDDDGNLCAHATSTCLILRSRT